MSTRSYGTDRVTRNEGDTGRRDKPLRRGVHFSLADAPDELAVAWDVLRDSDFEVLEAFHTEVLRHSRTGIPIVRPSNPPPLLDPGDPSV